MPFLPKFIVFYKNNYNESKDLNSSLIPKPPPDLSLLFNQCNNGIPGKNSDPENMMGTK